MGAEGHHQSIRAATLCTHRHHLWAYRNEMPAPTDRCYCGQYTWEEREKANHAKS